MGRGGLAWAPQRTAEMTRNKIILIALAAAALVAGWYFGSPRWTLWQMSRAAETRDSDRLASYIEFPTLRETSKAQLKAQMLEQMKGNQGNGGFGAVGAMIGMAMVDPVVDGALSPETMRAAFARAPERIEEAPDAKAGTGAKTGDTAPAGGQKKRPFGIDASNMEIVQKGFAEFRLRKEGAQGEDGDLIFRRHGLGWKLEEIRIPRDLLDDVPS